MTDPNYKGFIDLFPTKVHKFQIEPHLINSSLIGLDNSATGFNYTEVFNHPHYLDLQTEVEKCSQAICPSTSRTAKWKIVSCWLNNQAPNEKGFGFHNHADSFVSAVLYLKGSEMSLSFRDDAKEAKATNSENKDFDILVRHTWNEDANIPVHVGDLIFFPSHLLHQPNHNLTNENRISVAYNLMPCRYNSPNSSPWSMELNL